MYLKSIEVHGFKSFANKIHFQFHNGITAIVGPNGSGKSNVADAVRWVLGEQRIKQLRGASMQDVIFSGTEMRKPLGYAYVAITLDNRDHSLAIDYDEVTIARRLYRSGESEYLLNGTVCRLKDVNELFYDTGIGKEGYSIIGQGQIDKILSGKPEERRELFDEAAGIVKFKRRKDAAGKRLESERQNLLRVTDILSELEKQVGPLEKQSEKAKVYLRKREELKTLDVNVFLLENHKSQEQLESVEQKFRIASEDLSQATQEYQTIRDEYEQIQAQIERLEKEMEQERAQLTDTSVLRGKLESEIAVLQEQIHSAQGSDGHLQNRREALESEIALRLSQKEEILRQKEESDEQFQQQKKRQDEAAEALEKLRERIGELNDGIETGKNAIIQTLNDRAAIRSRMGRLDTMQEQVQIQKSQLASRLLTVKSDEEKQTETLKGLEAAFAQAGEQIRSIGEEQTQTEEKLAGLREELGEKDRQLRDAQILYHQEKSRLDALRNLAERYEGYGGSVRRVMEQKESVSGIIGVVADIIQVEKKYEVAIETALGSSIQNIVTKDEETAKRMISHLKQTRGGRATFLPLSSIKNAPAFPRREALQEEGALGLAHTLVTTQKEYADVARSLLGRIVVADNVDHALRIAAKYGYSFRIVTLEGELLVPGGAISGGAYKNSSNLLGRKREMEELEKKEKETLRLVDTLLDEIEQIKKRRNQLRLSLEELRENLQQAFIRQNTARLNVLAAQEKKSQAEAGLDSLKQEEEEILKQVRQIQTDKETIRKELEASETLEKETEAQIAVLQENLETERKEESRQTALLNQQDKETEKIRQQLGFIKANEDRIQGEIERYTRELSEVQEEIRSGQESIAQKQLQMKEIEKTILASHDVQSDTQKQLAQNAEEKEKLGAKQKNFFSAREELSGRMSGLDKEVYRLNAQKERLEETIESQINYMWDEYGLTLRDAALLRDAAMTDLAEMKRRASAVKEEIKRLGDVNVNAIEDYKNLMERYSFLKTQHDDLVEAEKTLTNIILELDEAMRKQFQEKFSEIGAEFNRVFQELFGGGRGTLQLIEDEDILEAGICIIAQPPGKKLQNMMQLSGGEKALTAIALLFAIQNLKPSPFCLLDEIEAALDDSNVGRYAKYLHKLTAHTQFIVITHRRGTMEAADRLYGITMQEKGVSALVSVNLIDKELTD